MIPSNKGCDLLPTGSGYPPVQWVMLRILIADDDPIIRLDLRQMLEREGYMIVAEAGDGQEAVQQAEQFLPDLCIVDVKMPVMDGIEAVKALSDVAPSILLTAYSDRELVDRAKQAGAFAYLVKPFKPSDLAPAIEVSRSRFEQNQLLIKSAEELNERLAARKLIEKAKGVLMEHESISEQEAYRKMQTESMNSRCSMKEVDSQFLQKYGADS